MATELSVSRDFHPHHPPFQIRVVPSRARGFRITQLRGEEASEYQVDDVEEGFMSKAWSYNKQPDGKDEWLTPPPIIASLGTFDLDPCSPMVRPWPTALNHFTIKDDGFKKQWAGRVWCNPPYEEAARWLGRCAEHGNAIAMVFARTETRMFFDHVWNSAGAVLFLKGRVKFFNVDGSVPKFTGGAPSCLAAYGKNNEDALGRAARNGDIKGKLVWLRDPDWEVSV